MTFEPLLTPKEAADFLRTSVQAIHTACSSGDLDHVLLDGNEPRFTREHLQASIERRTVRASAPTLGGDPGQSSAIADQPQFANTGILTETDVARILGISVRAVKKLVNEKRLRSIRLTKRKQVFTGGLIDEFLRGEKGLNTNRQDSSGFDPKLVGPEKSPISLEESRSLLKDLRKEMSPPDADERLTCVSQRR
jgi:hypothetical protein